MVIPVNSSRKGGFGCQYVGEILQDSSTGGDNLQVGDVGDVPTHWEDAGWVSPLVDPMTYRAASKTAGGWKMSVPTSCGGDVGSGVGGGGDLRCPPPEHSCTFYCNHNHYGSVSEGRAAPGSTSFLAMVVTIIYGLGGYSVHVKGGVNGREGVGGG